MATFDDLRYFKLPFMEFWDFCLCKQLFSSYLGKGGEFNAWPNKGFWLGHRAESKLGGSTVPFERITLPIGFMGLVNLPWD